MPLVTTDEIINYLVDRLDQTEPQVQVIDVYPAEDSQVSYGVYVNAINSIGRDPLVMGFGCSTYFARDEFKVLFVSFQNDPQSPEVEATIQALSQDMAMFDGYTRVYYSVDETVGDRSLKLTYTFNLERIDFDGQP